jgi:hypothetical protein
MPMPRRDVRPEEERVGRRRPRPPRHGSLGAGVGACADAAADDPGGHVGGIDGISVRRSPAGVVSSSPAQKVWRRLWAPTRADVAPMADDAA